MKPRPTSGNKSIFPGVNLSLLRALPCLCMMLVAASAHAAETDPLKVAVIGGLDMTGFWPQMEAIIEERVQIEIETVLASPKEQVVPAFISGEADVLLMHGGDEAFALEAQGYAEALRTWGYNEFVFVGPADDPADLRAASSGAEAMRRLQESGTPLISFRDIASQQIIRRLLDSAGLYPRDITLINDTAGRQQEILLQAARDRAYVIVGHIPVAFNRMRGDGTAIVLQGDPAMRRGYVVLQPGPRHPASAAARASAEKLADFLVSDAGQEALRSIQSNGGQWLLDRGAGSALIQFEAHPGAGTGESRRANRR